MNQFLRRGPMDIIVNVFLFLVLLLFTSHSPLLEDNTSYFIAADFDKKDWKKTIRKLYLKCVEYSIPAYIERSRSGNGGHLWIFFENAFPSEKRGNIF